MNLRKASLQLFSFGIIGLLNTILNLFTFWLLHDVLGVYYLISATVAFLISVTSSFFLNKHYTFQDRTNHRIKTKYIQFVGVSLISFSVNIVILIILVEQFGIIPLLAQVAGVASNFCINFFVNKYWTFRKQ